MQVLLRVVSVDDIIRGTSTLPFERYIQDLTLNFNHKSIMVILGKYKKGPSSLREPVTQPSLNKILNTAYSDHSRVPLDRLTSCRPKDPHQSGA